MGAGDRDGVGEGGGEGERGGLIFFGMHRILQIIVFCICICMKT